MKRTIILIIMLSAVSAIQARSQTFLQKIAGNWQGTLEYLDYSSNKRFKLKTYLTISPEMGGNSAEFTFVYNDVSRIVKETEKMKIDLAAKKYISGESEYKIDSYENSKIVLLGSSRDGEKADPVRRTITFDENSLYFLKETRSPRQFRNQMTFRRANENLLTKKNFLSRAA